MCSSDLAIVSAIEAAAGAACDANEPVIVGGVSLGAHAAATWCATRAHRGATLPDGLVLALPAWTGPPGPAAWATTSTAERIDDNGIDAVLSDLQAQWPQQRRLPLLLLGLAWPAYTDDELARALARAGRSSGPTVEQLMAITCPAVVLTWTDDPLHPEDVARVWARTLPRGRLGRLDWRELESHPLRFGQVALTALAEEAGWQT